jgi:hypothetical protein
MAMTATRQFLVTLEGYEPTDRSPAVAAHSLKYAVANLPSFTMEAEFEDVQVAPLPDLAADDTHLQLGFRALSASLCNWGPDHDPNCPVAILLTRHHVAALVAELSKQHPARTARVDHAALDAMRAIRESDKRPGQQVQKDARAQLIITDATCRCVPEDRA